MKLRNIIALPLLFSVVFFSCSKEESNEKPEEQPSNETYQPFSKGSTWHYKSTPQGSFTLTATGKDTVVDGVTLHVFEEKPDAVSQISNAYFGQKGDDYYALGFFPQLGSEMLLYLKGNAAPGTTWTQNITLNIDFQQFSGPTPVELDFNISEAGITKNVNDHTYDNVVHVTFQTYITASGFGKIPTGITGDLYFSQGVGLIDVIIKNPLSSITTEISLLDYSIK